MKEEKFGIDNVKKVLKLGISLGLHTASVSKDGFQYQDVFQLLPEIMQIPEILTNKDAIVEEVKDLSLAEIEELVLYVKDSGVFTNEKIKSIIVKTLVVVNAVADLIEEVKS